MKKYSLDDLSAFAAVARAGSYTRAAAALGMSKSNLSHTVRRLEAALGYRLLQRTSRSVTPTEAGETLLSTLAPALASIGDVVEDLDQHHDQIAGLLRLTATRQAYAAVIRPVLADFLRDYPDATVEILIDYAYRDIVADRLDAGIRLGEKLEKDMIARRVGPDLRMAVVASPAYLAGQDPILHPRDLIGHRCINYRMIGAGTIYSWEFEREGHVLDVRVGGPLTFNEPELMLEAALDGLGVGYLLDHEVTPHLEEGRLVRLLADWTPPFPGFHLYYPSRRHMRPILRAFIDRIVQNR